MFQRRVADLWRHCDDGVSAAVDWAQQYQQLLQELADLAAQEMVPEAELGSRLVDLVAAKRARRPPSPASIIHLPPWCHGLAGMFRVRWSRRGSTPTVARTA